MNDLPEILLNLWSGLGWPLVRLLCFVALGLLVANFIEALNWSHSVAKLAAPIIRLGRLPATVGASFSMAFFSGIAANTMLSEAYDQDRLDKRELILANLFNSMPTYFLHLPTVFFITAPIIKGAAIMYVALTFLAAVSRTALILVVGRFLLSAKPDAVGPEDTPKHERVDWRAAWAKTWKRFRKRMKKIVFLTAPIYSAIFVLSKLGMFDAVERMMTEHVGFLSWLDPQSLGIVVFHVAAEFTAGLAAAGALLDAGSLGNREIILALLVGNVLSSPMRAVRHQFPYYAGIFSPKLAFELILYSQLFRTGSIILVGVIYYYMTL
jgi:hypothetical protein